MHWNEIEALASALEETYIEEEIPEHNLEYLEEMVLSLPNFEDQEIKASRECLKNILENWLALRTN